MDGDDALQDSVSGPVGGSPHPPIDLREPGKSQMSRLSPLFNPAHRKQLRRMNGGVSPPHQGEIYFLDLVAAIARRWWVFLPVVIVFGFLTVQVLDNVQPTYGATASYLLIAPQPETPAAVLESQEEVDPQSFAALLSDGEVRAAVIPQGSDVNYTVAWDRGAVVTIKAAGSRGTDAVTAVQALIDAAPNVLQGYRERAGLVGRAPMLRVLSTPTVAPLDTAPDAPDFTYVATGALALYNELRVEENPLAQFTYASDVLVTILKSPQAQSQFPAAVFAVAPEAGNSAPIVNVRIEATDPDSVRITSRGLKDLLTSELVSLQDSLEIAEALRIRLVEIVPSDEVRLVATNRVRPAVVLVVTGVAVASLLALAIDGLFRRRRLVT